MFGFGFFLGYERIGPWWSALASFCFILLAALAAAYARADRHETSWQLLFSIVMFNSFVMGYNTGFPRKRDWWTRVVAANFAVICGISVYLIFIS